MADELSIDNEFLISLVEQRPVLWDKTMDLYKNRVATRQAWKEIMVALNPDCETKKDKTRQAYAKLIIQRWTHIRDNYNRSHKKRQDQKRFASGGKAVKPYVYSKQLSFLQKVIQLRESVSNVSDNSNTESDNQVINCEANETSLMSSSQTNRRVTMSPKSKKTSIRTGVNNSDPKTINFTDCSCNEPKINRHLSFFNGILPSLDSFDEDEVLEFQMGVLQLVKKIKDSHQSSASSSFNVKYDPLC